MQRNHTATKKEAPKKLSWLNSTPTRFGGKRDEILADWLRQFANYERLYEGFDKSNLHLFAIQFLYGEAGNYYDEITYKPDTWSDFCNILEKRYGKKKLDKAGLNRKFVNKRQETKQSLKDYVEEMWDLAEKAGLDDEVALQTILANMNSEKKLHYSFHMRNDMTFRNLKDLIEIGESDYLSYTENEKNCKNDQNEKESIEQKDDIITKLENLVLTFEKNGRESKYLRHKTFCQNCKRPGHVEKDCYSTTRNKDSEQSTTDKKVQYIEKTSWK